MKTNELMIGDWVYNKNIDKPMQIYPTIFSQMFRSNPNATTEDYNIFPIPLTPEILEKNGFKYKEGETGMYGVTITPHYICDGIPFEVFCDGEPFAIWFKEPVNIKYVHQLQHTLRLCGLEIEIQL